MLVNVLPFNSFINIFILISFEADMHVYIAALWQYTRYIIGGTVTIHDIYNWRHCGNIVI